MQAAGGEDSAALTGTWTNEDIDSPYSYPRKGRWITYTIDSVDCPDGTDASVVAFLENRARATLVAMSAVQAQVILTHLPIPMRVSDVLRFSHSEAGVDSRYVVTKMSLDTTSLGMMKTELQEVISL